MTRSVEPIAKRHAGQKIRPSSLRVAREELLTIQRSLEDSEPIGKSLIGLLKIISRRKLMLPTPKHSSH